MMRSTVMIVGTLALGLAVGCEAGERAAEDAVEEIDEATGVDTLEGPAVSGPRPQRVVVQAASYAYQPSAITVAPSTVWFIITNAADIEHGFEVEGHGLEEEIESIPAGSTDSLRVDFETSGEYEIYCPVDDHRQRGMTGSVTVG